MYQLLIDPLTGEIATTCLRRVEDGGLIPFDPANTDYQAYIAWVKEGNTPLDPDPIPLSDEEPT